ELSLLQALQRPGAASESDFQKRTLYWWRLGYRPAVSIPSVLLYCRAQAGPCRQTSRMPAFYVLLRYSAQGTAVVGILVFHTRRLTHQGSAVGCSARQKGSLYPGAGHKCLISERQRGLPEAF